MIHFVYIPGFGDHFDPLRRFALRRWKSDGVKLTFVPMRWNNKHETYEQKYERIAQAVEQAEGDEIVLVGESAGGAMAMLAFSRQLDRVNHAVTISGYNHGAADVHAYHKRAHPAFYQMMPVVDEIVRMLTPDVRRRITTIYSTRDRVVEPQHSRVDGAKERIKHTPVHALAITRVLLGGPPTFSL